MTTSKHKSKAYRDGYQAYLATNGRTEKVDTGYRNSKPLEAEFWRGWCDCKTGIGMKKIEHKDTYLLIDGVKHYYFIFSNVTGLPVDKETYDNHKGFKTCVKAKGNIPEKEIYRNSFHKPKMLFGV